MDILKQLCGSLKPLHEAAMEQAAQRISQLTKPPGSLGKLEETAVRMAGITGSLNPDLNKKAVVVMAGDHGVCEEGVSAFPQEVTTQMVQNMLSDGAAVNVFARQAGADVFCVDVGMREELADPRLIARNVRRGTDNIAKGPAMTRREAACAIWTGVETVRELAEKGYRLFATGEMGIGNTTPSSAVLSALTGIPVEANVGRGTGIDDFTLRRKRDVVMEALRVNQPDMTDALGVLSKVGGLEIAGLAGVVLGCAYLRLPVVIDGFISTVAALCATRIAPMSRDFLFASHRSQEKGHAAALESMELTPMLELGMRLGEGTGAVLAFTLLEASIRMMNEMATFESAGISKA
ncbi:nicotinate-nucleotide--dimethylbenzimidazole phosphoribosyltransferase [Marinicrinis lubricantis]|uniref:Nicotinate-nucleotide--dimethylbenzimidazole phosphoribosyltransferase n=1 Tax=Marinicrinis lubricantis TaxID=2086470 RepID=A0ABW1IR23_9BACL